MFQVSFDIRHWLCLPVLLVAIASTGCAGTDSATSGIPLAAVPEPEPKTAREEQPDPAPVSSRRDHTGWDLLRQSQAPSDSPDKKILLASAEQFLDHGHPETAVSVLQLVRRRDLNPSGMVELDLLRSRLALQSGQTDSALALLKPLEYQTISTAQQAERHLLTVRAYLRLKNVTAALESAQQLEKQVTQHVVNSAYPVLLNHLKSMPAAELVDLTANAVIPEMSGWAGLALLMIEHRWDAYGLDMALASWKQEHVDHPGNRYIPARLSAGLPQGKPVPRQLALLLPLSSVYAEAAQAVRDGILAMRQIDTNPAAPKVRIYDFGDRTELVSAYYQRAIDDGAEMVIGPLGKKAIGTLSELDALPVPTLVLGVSDGLPGNRAIGLSLSPEDEAFAVVRRAHRAGFRRAAILYPNSDWGRRMILAIRRHWQQFDGSIVTQRPYFQSASDHSTTLKQLLDIDRSLSRFKRLQNMIGGETKIRFIPRRRQDLDVLVMLAGPAQARLLKPQIDFHQAHDLPVFSTSRIFSGSPDPVANLDLEGVIFGDIPWMLTNTMGHGKFAGTGQRKLHRHTPLDRLFALGIDAYALVYRTTGLRSNPDLSHHGATGVIRIDRSGRILRDISWARFKEGHVTELPHTDHFVDG